MICFITRAAKCWIIGLVRVDGMSIFYPCLTAHFHFSGVFKCPFMSFHHKFTFFSWKFWLYFHNNHNILISKFPLFWLHSQIFMFISNSGPIVQCQFHICESKSNSLYNRAVRDRAMSTFNFNVSWFLFLSIMQLKQKVAFCHRGVLIYRCLFYEEYFFSLTKTSYQTCHNPSAILKGQVDVCLFLFREWGQFSWFC